MGSEAPALGARVGGVTRSVAHARVSSGHVVMVLAGVLGVLLTLGVLRSADNTQRVVVAAHDLAAGAIVDDSSVRVAEIRADGPVLATLFTVDQLDDVRGRVVSDRVVAGALIARADVRASNAGAAPRVMSFPVARPHAVGGELVTGDRVDIIATEPNTGAGSYVLTDAEIVAIGSARSGALAGGNDDLTVTVVVDPVKAPRLAAAAAAGNLTLVRSTDAAPLARPQVATP